MFFKRLSLSRESPSLPRLLKHLLPSFQPGSFLFRSTLSFLDVKISQLADKKKGISPFSNSVTSQSHTHQTRYQRKSSFLEVDLSGRVDEAYNWKALQALFFVRISHQSHTNPQLSGDAYKNSPLGIHLRVRINSVHETAPWCHRMRPFFVKHHRSHIWSQIS